MTDIPINLCKKCAGCCRNYPFISLSKCEIKRIEEYTSLRIDQFAESKEKEAEDYFLRFNENGDCFFLKNDNNVFACMIYEIRPAICKKYPYSAKQKKYCSENVNKIFVV